MTESSRSDHDLLIQVAEGIGHLRRDVTDLKKDSKDVATRLTRLESLPDDIEDLKTDNKNARDRLGRIETCLAWVMGASSALGAVAGWLASKFGGGWF